MREFEDTKVKYNQATGDPSLEGSAEHPDTSAVPVTTENSGKDRPEKIVVPQEWAHFLERLSDDSASAILKHLETTDLQSVSLVNKKANFLARDIQLKRYKKALEFSQSSLWQYLPAIAQDVPSVEGKAFLDYIEKMTNLTFNGDSRAPCEKLSKCIHYLRNRPGLPVN